MLNAKLESEIWTLDKEGNPSLIGSDCEECDLLSFPSKEVCPYCLTQGKSKKILIGRSGKIVSVTTCYTAPKGIQAPYSLGMVEIEKGVQVLVQISGKKLEKGAEVELIMYSFLEDNNEEGFGWKYQTIEGGEI